MKRFWDEVTVERGADGALVLLDGKPMRIPGGPPLLLHGDALAAAVAEEWRLAGGAKGGALSMEEVPLTRLAGTAQERIAPNHDAVAAGLAAYGESDLLCYRADSPAPLVLRQAREWQFWLDWADRTHGVRLHATEGVSFIAQDPAALARLQGLYAAMGNDALAALGIAVPAMGSAVLGLALEAGAITAEDAYAVSTLDEQFQREQWGEDTEATIRLERVREDIALAAQYIRLTRAG